MESWRTFWKLMGREFKAFNAEGIEISARLDEHGKWALSGGTELDQARFSALAAIGACGLEYQHKGNPPPMELLKGYRSARKATAAVLH